MADFDAYTVPCRRAQRDEPEQRLHIGGKLSVDQRLIDFGKIAMVDAEGAACLCASALLQVLVHNLRQKRHHGREELNQGRKYVVERLVGRRLVFALFTLPKAAAVSPHIPVAELFGHESFGRKTKGHHVVVFELAPGGLDQ